MQTRNRRRIQAVYDRLGGGYTELYGKEQQEKHEVLLKKTSIERSDVCLDLGCGPGALMTRVARKSRFVVGIDIALSMVFATKKRPCSGSKCEVVWAAGEYLPFRQHAFQTLFAITVVLDPQGVSRTIDEAKRTLSSGGLAVFTVFRKAKEFHRSESLIERNLVGWEVSKMQVGRDVGWFAKKV